MSRRLAALLFLACALGFARTAAAQPAGETSEMLVASELRIGAITGLDHAGGPPSLRIQAKTSAAASRGPTTPRTTTREGRLITAQECNAGHVPRLPSPESIPIPRPSSLIPGSELE